MNSFLGWLRGLTGKGTSGPLAGDTALLVIDVQRGFCVVPPTAESECDEKAGFIASVIPAFRKAGVRVYAIHYTVEAGDWCSDPSKIDFHKFKPDPEKDIILRKGGCSAFSSTGLGERLKEQGVKSVLACGFSTGGCVQETVLDAAALGLDVSVLSDMIGDDSEGPEGRRKAISTMKKSRIRFVDSAAVLKHFQGR